MWNHRIVRKKHKTHDGGTEYTYGIHEALYDKNGKVTTITVDPVAPFGSNIQELRESWLMFSEAFGQPILDSNAIPEEGHDKNDPLVAPIDTSKTVEWVPPWKKSKKAAAKWKKELAEMRKEDEKKRKRDEKVHAEYFVGTKTRTDLVEKIQQAVIAAKLQKEIDAKSKKKKGK